MIVEKLTNSTVLLYAMANYDNPQCYSLTEFKQDIKMFGKLNRQLGRVNTTDINLNLVLNGVITLNNLFGHATSRLFFYYISERNYEELMTFLHFTNTEPTFIPDLTQTLPDKNDELLQRLHNL